ncbi:MAG: hypothetical protein J7M19_03180 [Planctomycetes bacterium]|nr:hypothetical protein [Planctomycetota bacterium]
MENVTVLDRMLVIAAVACACALAGGAAAGDAEIVPIPEFKRWESNMIEYGRKHFDERSKGISEGNVWYYDGQRVFYQIADYTGDEKWIEAAHNSRETYRGYILENDGRIPGWRIFPHGLQMDWERHRNADSRKAAVLLAKESAFAATGGGADEGLSRETAYCINAYIAAEHLGEPRSPHLEKSVAWALGHINQWFVENSSDNWAPFMFGLTCEALINYYDNVKKDPRILPKIKMGLDECWKRAWVEKDQAFWYRANDKSKGAPDLNLLVAPAYAWVYLQTGDVKYRDRGDKLFAGGVKGAWLDGGKQFSQNYRWSFHYVKWRAEAERRRTGIPRKPGKGAI